METFQLDMKIGGIISFIGFTLPSVIALILFVLVFTGVDLEMLGGLHGLKIVEAAIVVHAIIGIAKNLTPDLKRKTIAFV